MLHDQFTVRVCLEYFTIGHAPVFPTHDPTLLGLGWGVIATWWVGLALGVGLAIAARAGSRPRRDLQSLLRPVGKLLAVMAAAALMMGIAGWIAADAGWVRLWGEMAQRVPAEKQVPFMAAMWAHSASYVVGIVGGVETIISVWRSRSPNKKSDGPR